MAIVEDGLKRVLHTLKVVSGEALPEPQYETTYLSVKGESHYVFSPVLGIFEPAVLLGEQVTEGQLAGRVFNPHAPWAPPVTLSFQAAGYVMCIRSFAAAEPGDCLVLLASDASSLEGGFD